MVVELIMQAANDQRAAECSLNSWACPEVMQDRRRAQTVEVRVG
jgi:hypothetical protein